MLEPTIPTERVSWVDAGVVALAAVIGVSGQWSLWLANARWWSLSAWASGTLAATLAIAVVVHDWRPGRPDRWEVVGALGAVAGVVALAIPAFRFGMSGWDPGVYVAHARSIAAHGSSTVPDPLAMLDGTALDREALGIDARFPALLPDRAGRLDFGFFHLFPAMAAPAVAILGTAGISLVNPGLAVLGVFALFRLGSQAAGPVVGAIAAVVLSTSFVWVWHVRLPSTEVPTAAFVLVGLHALWLAWDTRRRSLAVVAGLLFGVAANFRADGLLVLLLAVGLVAAAAAAGRSRSLEWVWLGLVPGALQWARQSYDTADRYARNHDIPPLPVAVLLVAVPIIAALVLRRTGVGPRLADRVAASQQRWWFGAGLVAAVGVAGFAVRSLASADGDPADYPTFYPHAIERVGMFWWWTGSAAIVIGGWALIRFRRHRLAAIVLPGLLVAPLYLWEARIDARLIWWTRRFVPLVWPALALVAALGIVVLAGRLAPRRQVLAATAVTVLVVAPQLWWQRDVRGHLELDGSLALPDTVVATTGRSDPTIVWFAGQSFSAFGLPTEVNTDATVISTAPDFEPARLDEIRRALDVDELFVVADAGTEVPEVGGLEATELAVLRADYPYLGFTWESVPTEIDELGYAVRVVRLDPTG